MDTSYANMSASASALERNVVPFSIRTRDGTRLYLYINKDNITVKDPAGRVQYSYRFESIMRWGANGDQFAMLCQKESQSGFFKAGLLKGGLLKGGLLKGGLLKGGLLKAGLLKVGLLKPASPPLEAPWLDADGALRYSYWTDEAGMISDALMARILAYMDEQGMSQT